MRLSILADDNRTALEPSVGGNADRPAEVEPPETAEYLFIGPPPGSARRHAQHAAGLGVLAAVALTTWLLTTSSNNDTGPTALISASASPQQSTSLPGLANADSNAGSVNRPAASSEFCLNSPGLCGPTAPTSLVSGYVTFCEKSPTLCIVANPASEQYLVNPR
jgi:hypothetical protein